MIGQLYSVNLNNYENYLFGIDYVLSENLAPLGSDIIKFDLDLNLKTNLVEVKTIKDQRQDITIFKLIMKEIFMWEIFLIIQFKFKPIKTLD